MLFTKEHSAEHYYTHTPANPDPDCEECKQAGWVKVEEDELIIDWETPTVEGLVYQQS